MTFIPGPANPLAPAQAAPMPVFAIAGAPASEPVDVATFRAYAKLDDNDDDASLEGLLSSARAIVERHSGRILIAQTWTCALERWPDAGPDGRVRLRLSPAPLSISGVTVDGTTLATSFYALRGDEIVCGPDLAAFPTGESASGGIVISFAANAAASAYPQLLTAIQMLAAGWHRNPEATHTFEAGLSAQPLAYRLAIESARVMRELN